MPFVPAGIPGLECDNSPTLRAHPAGLSMVATSVSDEAEDPPPSAASAEAHRTQVLTSTVRHAASSDLLPEIADHIRFESSGDGRTRRAVRTVEVELEFETPSLRPPQAGTYCPAADGLSDHF
jgi:hypothetical protein